MEEGGPAIIVWGWPIVGILTLLVGLSMAEVCSSFPTAGGLYYWAAKLSPRHGPVWSWFTGWFNFLGQVAVTAGIDFGARCSSTSCSAWFDFSVTTHWLTIVIYAAVLLLHGTMNQFGIRLVALLNNVSVWWHIIGVLIIVGAMVFGLKAGAHHASAKFVFTNLARTCPGSARLVLHPAARAAAGPVHLHRVRRVGAHDRGDAQRRAQRARAASSCRSWSR